MVGGCVWGAGSGAELVAIMASLDSSSNVDVVIQDIGEWEEILAGLASGWNAVGIKWQFHHGDVMDACDVLSEQLKEAAVVTGMFVWNEMFASRKADAMKLVKMLVTNMKSGSHLLVFL